MKIGQYTSEHFLSLLKPHYQAAANYCRGLDPEHHQDILQEALLKALRGMPSLKNDERFKSWLFTIITREAATCHRRHFWRRFLEWDNGQEDNYGQPTDGPQREELNQLLHSLEHLPAKKRETILLHEVGGFSILEIAAFYRESESAVKSRLARTRNMLAQWLRKGLRESDNPKSMLEMYNEVETVFVRSQDQAAS